MFRLAIFWSKEQNEELIKKVPLYKFWLFYGNLDKWKQNVENREKVLNLGMSQIYWRTSQSSDYQMSERRLKKYHFRKRSSPTSVYISMEVLTIKAESVVLEKMRQ